MLSELFWKGIATIVSIPAVANWIIRHSQKTPYSHLVDGEQGPITTGPNYVITKFSNLYMGRWWLFNAYEPGTRRTKYNWFPWSIRVHKIARADLDEHQHDHPWDYARTIIIKGRGYWERRGKIIHWRRVGDTVRLDNGIFHRIEHVTDNEVWTLFITKTVVSTWGFMVDGKKVVHTEYFRIRNQHKRG